VIAVWLFFLAARKPDYPPKQNQPALITPAVVSPKNVSLYYSTAEKTKFCNGDDMDSAGYAKTINEQAAFPYPNRLKPGSAISYLVNAGADYVGRTVFLPASFVKTCNLNLEMMSRTCLIGGGWAGISIEMCTCEPFLDYNLSRSFGINKNILGRKPGGVGCHKITF